ncbi:hypothetical protein BDV96DRAFT_661907 [Lophiotrema nucula]|uniref:Uncharacterized protein n=1 Tax=Lophiotrema nucula TaxID=690887 RepID=A0A6A5Z432_9PLEO|nr:hypothetical protein BDV96DRAFT_661907 [Lophiotrema nucula]
MYIALASEKNIYDLHTSTSTMSSASILRIPLELRIQIYRYLLTHDYIVQGCKNLRLVCHQMKAEVDQEVIRRTNTALSELSTRKIMANEYDLIIEKISTPTTFRETRKIEIEIRVSSGNQAGSHASGTIVNVLEKLPPHIREVSFRFVTDKSNGSLTNVDSAMHSTLGKVFYFFYTLRGA